MENIQKIDDYTFQYPPMKGKTGDLDSLNKDREEAVKVRDRYTQKIADIDALVAKVKLLGVRTKAKEATIENGQ